MGKKKVLMISQDMAPYTEGTDVSEVALKLPQFLHDQGMELRILIPRYGIINERRHRLHEVVRLSGLNIIVNDDDYPLIIKVASLPSSRMQVYFLENDDFFKRKAMFHEEDGTSYEDNADRMAFFCKGVLETVKKFGWAPDIIHCHGWMTSMIPFYLQTSYKTEPIFQHSKVIYSLYQPEEVFDKAYFSEKVLPPQFKPEDLEPYIEGDKAYPHLGAIRLSDAVIKGGDTLPEYAEEKLKNSEKLYLEFYDKENYLPSYLEIYKQLLD